MIVETFSWEECEICVRIWICCDVLVMEIFFLVVIYVLVMVICVSLVMVTVLRTFFLVEIFSEVILIFVLVETWIVVVEDCVVLADISGPGLEQQSPPDHQSDLRPCV